MDAELKPCPMCAKEYVIITEQTIPKVGNPWRVSCNVCFLSTGQYIARSEAVTAWNTRPCTADERTAEIVAWLRANEPPFKHGPAIERSAYRRDIATAIEREFP